MSDAMDIPEAFDKNDPRYDKAIELVAHGAVGIQLAKSAFSSGEFDLALEICLTVKKLMVEANEVIYEIGDIDAAMFTGQAISELNQKIEQIQKIIEERDS